MLGLPTPIAFFPSTLISIPSLSNSNSNPNPLPPLTPTPKPPYPTLKFQPRTNPRKPRKFQIFAENGNGPSRDPKEEREEEGGFKKEKEKEEDVKSNGRPTFNLSWADLVLDPDPDNILAVGLTGILAWASALVLWQLFFISLAIIVAALKYSFIAALLIFILITLL
ncbi:uncharacterized protein LOC131300658 [Rhododendron vialii]|uniref:uncharacterized protein LOC131300658 n=1 Tax=Rhododendron vialii TaxID=182163 RepID=UPI00265D6A70|nr:uncharacterized protein LOC131300658 [Rhododendron vialii]